MGVSRGKQFEEQIRKALEKYCEEISVDRFPDPMAGYKGIRNICDFGVYKFPYQYYFECKAYSKNTLSIYSNDSRRKYGAITNDQWEGLQEKSRIRGVKAGVLIWFIDHDLTIYVPIQELVKLRNEGNKSLNIKDIPNIKHYKIPAIKKRILFDYDMKWLLNILGEQNGKE